MSLNLPTSWNLIATPDDFAAQIFAAIKAMMLDVLAAVARKVIMIVDVGRPKGRTVPELQVSTRVALRTLLAIRRSPGRYEMAIAGVRS